ncbi:hypothetical protein PIROE2DRAFT_19325 [Piromyces sp. E2]|nr:hypothetical protein PIROE2DRAFT_19325 [Piromyces sp. E2]|eukprot:OUM56183.1 hypothetical protein PIROE2DRAFT_19325 [Piromyces sp. E2]
MKILRSRLYGMKRQKLQNERTSNRHSQVGTGDHSERIRSSDQFNFLQTSADYERFSNGRNYQAVDKVLSGRTDHEFSKR